MLYCFSFVNYYLFVEKVSTIVLESDDDTDSVESYNTVHSNEYELVRLSDEDYSDSDDDDENSDVVDDLDDLDSNSSFEDYYYHNQNLNSDDHRLTDQSKSDDTSQDTDSD